MTYTVSSGTLNSSIPIPSVPIIVFLGISVLDFGPMYATDVRRQTDVRRASSLNAPAVGAGHNK